MISELGRESNLKLVLESIGLSGFILCEQDAKSNKKNIEEISPFPFMLFVNTIKISKEKKSGNSRSFKIAGKLNS
ncbi:MAG: hypothetical protein ACXWWA_14275 [Chitinophagaceae bacterium]